MVCCRIRGRLGDGDFSAAFKTLCALGDVLCVGDDTVYLGSDRPEVAEADVRSAMSACGYDGKYYIETYDAANPPREDGYVLGWLLDRLASMERKYQESVLRDEMLRRKAGLDALNARLDEALAKLPKEGDGQTEGQ